MACGSSCCEPPSRAPPEEDCCSTQRSEQEDPCCVDDVPVTSLKKPEIADTECNESIQSFDKQCQDSCCGELVEELQADKTCENKAQEVDLKDDCCTQQLSKSSCSKGCCAKGDKPCPDIMKAPPCCEGKISPCCDQTCLDRLALRECESLGSGKQHDCSTNPHAYESNLVNSQV